MPAGSVSAEASLLSCCCAHKAYTLYAHGEAGSSLAPLPIRAPILSSQSPTLLTSFSLNYILWTPSPNTVTPGVRASTNKFGGDTVPSITISLTVRTDSRHLNAFLRLPLLFHSPCISRGCSCHGPACNKYCGEPCNQKRTQRPCCCCCFKIKGFFFLYSPHIKIYH